MHTSKIRSGAGLFAVMAALLVHPAGLGAQTLPLDFAPPDIAGTPVCVPRSSDADLLAEWSAWDQRTLPDRDIGLINRDLRRLSEIDPLAWDETISKAILLLPAVSPSYTEDHVTLARIEHMITLGQLQELRAEGLVQRLLDRGDENSPRMLNALAGFLTEGIGIDRDTARGSEFLMAAGYGGNADALLTLSRLAVAGTAPKAWDINPQLAVTMAFGSLVGQIDPLICDRIARIAREFSSGEIVSVDHDLAVRWYRFAADLGDPIAAWRVAEYQLQSELVSKDNDVLMTYLTKAADGRLPYAQVALGRIYETGALVPVDMAKALTLYEAAAADNDRAGLIRLSGFLEAQLAKNPTVKPDFVQTLVRLEALQDPPAWVFAKHAANILAEQGRWTGQSAARQLLEQGAARQDPAAIVMLAQMNFGAATTEPQFFAAADQLIQTVSSLGEAAPTADLYAAFMCKAPHAPMLDQASYWAAAEAAIGSSSVQFTDQALANLADNPDPLAMAALQTQALYGRATPLANLLAVLERDGSPASEIAFWTAYADRFANVATARATLALGQATTAAERDAALAQFRTAMAAGESGAALKLAQALLVNATDVGRSEALTLLLPLAQDGNGEAMGLLPSANRQTYPTVRAVYDSFAATIDTRGDFLALMLALPYLPDTAIRDDYYRRAIAAISCTFPEAAAFAEALGAQGDLPGARRWLTIASHLAGQDSWQIVALADSYRNLLGDEGEPEALAFYEQAYALGNRTAVQRLLRIEGDPKKAGYNPDRMITLYTELVARSSASQIPGVLEEVSRKDVTIRAAIEARLDLDQLYARAAGTGNPVAMREHATRLRAGAASSQDIEASTGWLIRASEVGDLPSMMLLSQAYSMGVGVPASLDKARGWLQKAADAGDPQAIEMVKLFTVDSGTN